MNLNAKCGPDKSGLDKTVRKDQLTINANSFEVKYSTGTYG